MNITNILEKYKHLKAWGDQKTIAKLAGVSEKTVSNAFEKKTCSTKLGISIARFYWDKSNTLKRLENPPSEVIEEATIDEMRGDYFYESGRQEALKQSIKSMLFLLPIPKAWELLETMTKQYRDANNRVHK